MLQKVAAQDGETTIWVQCSVTEGGCPGWDKPPFYCNVVLQKVAAQDERNHHFSKVLKKVAVQDERNLHFSVV